MDKLLCGSLTFLVVASLVSGLDPDEEKAFCDFTKVANCPYKSYCKSVCNYTGGWICGGHCGTNKNEGHIVKIAYRDLNATALPESFGSLTYLSELSFTNSGMYTLPESFGSLSLAKGSLRKLPNTFGNLLSLSSLKINDCALSVLPNSFGSLTSLSHLDLYGNKLVTLSANVFDSMASLKSLYLGDNMFTTVPTYPAERVTTASSPYFLGGNYLSETQYGLQHACSDHDKNATQCRSILACNYDTIENECNTASSSTITTIPDDTFVYPAPPTIPDDDDDNNNDKSTSGSNSDDDDEWSDDNNIDEWNIKPSQDSDTTLSGSMIAVWVVVAVVGALVLVLLVLLAAVKGRQAHEERQRRRKSEIETPEEREKQAMRDSKRREKDAAKQRKREAKKQRLALEQRRKSRILEIEMEENGAVPMSPAAYSVGSREVDAADVMVLSELGAGTLGAVHKAKLISHRSGGLVAAKLIRLELVADYPTFAAEARRLSELQSPSSSSPSPSPSPFLVPVFGVAMYPTPQENTPVGKENEINDNVGEEEEEEDGGGLAEGCGHKCPKSCFCILSEYVPAPNMRQFVWKGNSTDRPLFKLRLCISIARGLQYLHENGALHRDLKPENVLVVSEDPNAEVICRLCDYATAGLKVKETAMDFSRGTGTPQYLAPEVMSGEAQEFSTMADVFSFGVVGFEAFREEAVYSENKFSSNFALMRYVLSGKRPAANDKVAQDCTPDTVALFESCWAQDPSLRPDIPSIISRLEEFASNLNFV